MGDKPDIAGRIAAALAQAWPDEPAQRGTDVTCKPCKEAPSQHVSINIIGDGNTVMIGCPGDSPVDRLPNQNLPGTALGRRRHILSQVSPSPPSGAVEKRDK